MTHAEAVQLALRTLAACGAIALFFLVIVGAVETWRALRHR